MVEEEAILCGRMNPVAENIRTSPGLTLVRASLCIPPLNEQLGWLPESIDATARGAVM
jgi:hypothetical protein